MWRGTHCHRELRKNKEGGAQMTGLILDNVKLIILFALVGSVLGLSSLNTKNIARMKRAFAKLHRHDFPRAD
jgi:hypothetical protein